MVFKIEIYTERNIDANSVYVQGCMNIYMCICVHLCVYICTFIHTISVRVYGYLVITHTCTHLSSSHLKGLGAASPQ